VTEQSEIAGPDGSTSAVDRIVEVARSRLTELQPLLEEVGRLREVLAATETLPGPTHIPARKARILAIVDDNPGITVAEIADGYGMKRSVVASSISRLKRSGEIVSQGGGVRLPRSGSA
jgi:DNA-binding MarR family transcriptional regulator